MVEIINDRIIIPINVEFDQSQIPQQQDAHVRAFEQQQALKDAGIGLDDLKSAVSAIQNIEGFMINVLTRQLPILGGILSAKEIAEFIIEELTRDGGPFDRRFKLIIEKQFNNLRTPEHNWAVRVGNKVLIISTMPGHRGQGGDTNSLREIRENPSRTFEFTIDDKATRLR